MAQPSSDNVRTFTVGEDDDGIRLDRWFKRHLPDISFNIVSRWARTGQLRVDGKRAAPGDRLETGQVLRVPPAEAAPAEGPGARPKRMVEPLTEEEAEFVQEMVLAKGRDWFMLNKPPGLATQGGTKTVQHLDRLLDGLADEDGQRPKLVHRLDKDTSGVLLVARSARAAGHFAKAFAGRTARKVYWALIVGVPSAEEGLIDAPLAKQPGTGGEKMHVDEENGLPAQDPLPPDRPGRQPRRLGRASAADRPHPPASRAYGGDRPSDRRRRQIWRGRGVPDRRDQPQDAPPCAAAEDRRARRQADRLHRRPSGAFCRKPGDARVRA